MTVSIESTSRKYHGRKAETYESVRTKQIRWGLENDEVRRMLEMVKPTTVLDVPVGTGRFIPMYVYVKTKVVIGVDISDEMLNQAQEKATRAVRRNRIAIYLKNRDVLKMAIDPVDVSVCVRFLDLIEEDAMQKVMRKLMRCSTRAIICTIRLGPTYIPKSNTATHHAKRFFTLIKKHGWKVSIATPVFTQGWYIFLLKPRS